MESSDARHLKIALELVEVVDLPELTEVIFWLCLKHHHFTPHADFTADRRHQKTLVIMARIIFLDALLGKLSLLSL